MTRTAEGTGDVHTRAADDDSAQYPDRPPSARAVTDGDHAGATNSMRAQSQRSRISPPRLGQSYLPAVCLLRARNAGMARRSIDARAAATAASGETALLGRVRM